MSGNQIQPGIATTYVDPTGYARQLEDQFFGTLYAAVTLNSASGGTPQIILSPPAGSYIFIRGIQITVDPTCTLSAAGMETTTITASTSGIVGALRSYIPATFTAPTVPTVLRQTSAPGNFFATVAPGETITVANSVALTAGSIRVAFNYGLSNVPIGNL